MNEWEAKYKALAVGIEDEALVEKAEAIVRRCVEIHHSTTQPFEQVVEAMLDTLSTLRSTEKPDAASRMASFERRMKE